MKLFGVLVLTLVSLASAWNVPYRDNYGYGYGLGLGFGRSSTDRDTCNFLEVSPFFKTAEVEDELEIGTLSRMAVREELVMLTEYARFMNKKIPELLKEFVETKRMFKVEETMSRFKDALNRMEAVPDIGSPKFFFDQYSFRMPKDLNEEEEIVDLDRDGSGSGNEGSGNEGSGNEGSGNEGSGNEGSGDEESGDEPSTESSVGEELGEAVGDVIVAVTNSTQDVIQIFTDVIDSVGSILQENLPPFVWEALCKATWYPYHEEKCRDMRCAACSPSVMAATAVCKTTFKTVRRRCVEEVMGEGFCTTCIREFI